MIVKIVKGSAMNSKGGPISNAKIEVYLKNLRNDKLLGETITDNCGKYTLQYEIDDSNFITNSCEEKTKPIANIYVRVYICQSPLSQSGFDMFCQSQNTECDTFIQSSTVYNASDEHVIDIIEGGTIIEDPKFDRLTLEIRKLIYDMKIEDLIVDNEHNDLEYVSNLLQITSQEVLNIILCHRMQEIDNRATISFALQNNISSLENYIYYPFLEYKTIDNLNELLTPLYTTFENIIDILKSIKNKIIDLSADTQKDILEKAMLDNLIQDMSQEKLNETLEILNDLRLQNIATDSIIDGGSTNLEVLNISNVVSSNVITVEEFMEVYSQNDNSIEWTVNELKQSYPDFTIELANKLLNTFTLNELTLCHEPMTSLLLDEIYGSNYNNFLSDFAKLSQSDWENKIRTLINSNKDGYPEITIGENQNEKISNYAKSLLNNFHAKYPNSHNLSSLIKSHPELRSTLLISNIYNLSNVIGDKPIEEINIDSFLFSPQIQMESISAKAVISPEDIEDIKRFQRAFRITKDSNLVSILYEEDLSAQHIYLMGRGNFIEDMIKKNINETIANEAYDNAAMIYANLASEFAKLNKFTNKLAPDAVGTLTPSQEQLSKLSNFNSLNALMGYNVSTNSTDLDVDPSYETLFNNPSYCECEQCKSIHSASAYLVDILNFLSYRRLKKSDITKTAKDVLFERRPDIGEIQLSCENTNTPLPYIDLVCEILENQISTEKIVSQTTKTEEELKANPENVNESVYKKLTDITTTRYLPFNLFNEEARKYLNAININYDELIYLFAKDSSDKEYLVALENLQINYAEGEFLLKPKNDDNSKNEALLRNSKKIIDILNKTGLSYNEFEDMFSTKYISGLEVCTMENPYDCDISNRQFKIPYYAIVYNLPVLIRLKQHTSWRVCDIDRIIKISRDVDKQFFINLRNLKLLSKELNLTIEQLAIFHNDFDRGISYTRDSNNVYYLENGEKVSNLYDELFLNTTVSNGSQIDSDFDHISGDKSLKDHKETILSGLQLKENELNNLLLHLDTKLDTVSTIGVVLNIKNLSIITRYTLLAKSLSLSIEDLFKTIDIIYGSNYDIFASPKDTKDFINNYNEILKYQFDLSQLIYILKYTADADSLISKDDVIKQYISNLRRDIVNLNKYQRDSIIIEKTASVFELQIPTTNYILNEMSYDNVKIIENISNDETMRKLLEKDKNNKYVNEINKENFPSIFNVYYLLHKISLLINKLNMDSSEVIIINEIKNVLNFIDFEKLPIKPDSRVDFSSWLNLVKLYEFKNYYPKHDEISIFDTLNYIILDNDLNKFNQLLCKLTYWNIDNIEKLQNQNNIKSTSDITISTLLKYHNQIKMINKVGIKVEDIFNYVKTDIFSPRDLSNINDPKNYQGEITDSIKKVVKAKFENKQWLDVSANIQDEIRIKKRDALVDYLMNIKPSSDDVYKEIFTSENQIYEFFLIDTQMSPCQLTTRILQANASIQLFVQRCIMNLEEYRISDNDEKWSEWNSWMKRYRVWEANQKVFLYPENWIEPELRDDKTPFFIELEQKLNQNEITNDYVEELYLEYLEKVEEIAHLRICGLTKEYYKVKTGTIEDIYSEDRNNYTVHLVGRTLQEPYTYYYRTQKVTNGAIVWSPWEKIDININTEQILLFVFNRRLYMFWLDIQDKPYKTQDLGTENNPAKESKIFWSLKPSFIVYKNNKWSGIKTSSIEFPFTQRDIFGKDKSVINLRGEVVGDNYVNIYISNNNKYILDNDKYRLNTYLIKFDGTIFYIMRYNSAPDNPKWGIQAEIDKCMGNDYKIESRTDSITSIKYNPDVLDYKYNYLINNKSQTSRVAIRNDFPYEWGSVFNSKPCEVIKRLDNDDLNPNGPFICQDLNRQYFVNFNCEFSDDRINNIISSYKQCSLVKGKKSNESFMVNGIGGFEGEWYYRIPPDFIKECICITMKNINNIYDLLNITNTNTIVELFDKYPIYSSDIGESIMGRYIYIREKQNMWLNSNYYYITWCPYPLYHPYINKFSKELIKHGIDGILNRDIQLSTNEFSFTKTYEKDKYPCTIIRYGDSKYDNSDKEIVDFSDYGSYSLYNWEIFFHIPMLIANKLHQNQRFDEAQKWYHYIFNPTSISNDPIPNKYWITKPFYKTTEKEYASQEINQYMSDVYSIETSNAINMWRENPFNPHLIARTRTVAYQKNVVMKYIDNLIDWADQLFRQNTFESINEAIQIYIVAAKILGSKPIKLPGQYVSPKTYNELVKDKINSFENKIAENAIQPIKKAFYITSKKTVIPNISSLYFCLTPNSELLNYWDTVADRLYKIRNCMNIEGIIQKLNLFEPPIDPAILVKATAQGVDLDSILDDMSGANVGYYRFKVLCQKGNYLCLQLQNLSKYLLKVLEIKDAEGLQALVATTSTDILDILENIKNKEVEEAKYNLEALKKSKETLNKKYKYYSDIKKIIDEEKTQRSKLKDAMKTKYATIPFHFVASIGYAVPTSEAGIAGVFGSPRAAIKFGGDQIGEVYGQYANILDAAADGASLEAQMAGIKAEGDRNWDEYKYEKESAESEIEDIEQQIKAAQIRLDIVKEELQNQIKENRDQALVEEYLSSKYTNEELYNWLISQVSTVYFKAYKLAYDMAKKAQASYQYELGKTVNFIEFGYWDSLKKGLMAGEKLYQDIKTMEMSYMDENKRVYELTKHFSLKKFNPVALQLLKESGYCYINLPELIFDMDYHDHYFRRIKSVSITVDCEKDKNTTLSCTLTLNQSKYRVNQDVTNGYIEVKNDSRFIDVKNIPCNSIATSSGINDRGLFDFDLDDERYLPFEGAGAISDWLIELNCDYKQYDFSTIKDLVINMDYTAKQGTDTSFKETARKEIKEAINSKIKASLVFNKAIDLYNTTKTHPGQSDLNGLYKVFSLKNDYTTQWNDLLTSEGNMSVINIDLSKDMFSYDKEIRITKIEYFALVTKDFMYGGNKIKTYCLLGNYNSGDKSYPFDTFDYKLNVKNNVEDEVSKILYKSTILESKQNFVNKLSVYILNAVSDQDDTEIPLKSEDIEDMIVIINYELKD